ncbi:MAG: hypothetical protein ACRDPK_08695 [Carbonactinosporaceae bacterium]
MRMITRGLVVTAAAASLSLLGAGAASAQPDIDNVLVTDANVVGNVPANVCGNNIAALGNASDASAGCAATGASTLQGEPTTMQDSVAGTDADVLLNVPLNVCGNNIGILGNASGASANCVS